jgi:hypothetical protein
MVKKSVITDHVACESCVSNIVTILFHRWNSVVTQLSYNGKDMDFEINGVHMLVVDNHEFYE